MQSIGAAAAVESRTQEDICDWEEGVLYVLPEPQLR
jgi:hypothetical protein